MATTHPELKMIVEGKEVRLLSMSEETTPGVFADTMGGTVPDLRWKFTDEAGHRHVYGQDKSLPSLKAVTERVTVHGDSWEEIDHYECIACGEEVTPGVKSEGPTRVVIEPPRLIANFFIEDTLGVLDLKVYSLVRVAWAARRRMNFCNAEVLARDLVVGERTKYTLVQASEIE